jgi:hypothetical protein
MTKRDQGCAREFPLGTVTHEATMESRKVKFNRLAVPLVTLVVLLALFGIYQSYYVKSREAYLTEHGFRLLAAVGRQLDGYVGSITNALEAASAPEPPRTVPPGRAQDYLEHFLPTLDPNLTPQDVCVGPRCRAEQTGPDTVFSFRLGTGPGLSMPSSISGSLLLDKGIRERLNFGEDYFDDVLIADRNGRVLFQKDQYNRIVSLVPLVIPTPNHPASGEPGSGAPSGDGKEQAADGTVSQRAAFLALSQASNVFDVKVAGEDFRLFVEPFQWSFNRTLGGSLILCGLWRTERLHSDTFALPYSDVIFFGLMCVAIGCFSWPILKITYTSRTERLRRRDTWLLLFSTVFGTTSVLLMALNSAYASQVTTEIDRDLDALAARIQDNVNAEIKRALQQLAALSEGDRGNEVEKEAALGWAPRTAILTRLGRDPEYPYFDFAFWLDSSGLQR